MGEANAAGGGKLKGADLGSIGPRRAGSEPERRAAKLLQQRLQEMGRSAELEPSRIRPNFALTHLIHAVAGIVASVLSVYIPAAGLLLALVTTVSAFGDLTGSFHLIRLLTPSRASQNVVSDEGSDKPGLLVLTAHYDSPVAGLLAHPRLKVWPKLMLGSLGVITLCTLGRLAGLESTIFTLVQFIPTVVLIALTPACADTAISDPVDDPADNDAGVDAVLRVAESHTGRLSHFDLMVVFTGGSANFGLGTQAWLARHRREVDPQATAVISIDNLAPGEPAAVRKEGAVFAARMHPALAELAREAGFESVNSGEISDAYIARAGGLPALRITTTPGDGDGDVAQLTADLLDRVDQEIGRLLS
jgi:hypothetical protein